MSKKKSVKVRLDDVESFCTFNKKSTVIILSDTDRGTVELNMVIPKQDDMEGVEFSNALSLGTAIAVRVRKDKKFTEDLLNWFADFVNDPENLKVPITESGGV